ncbi:MAG: nuclear transport factor 2 family protein [Alphaproteobacteria bacterium]|nr:nuclear transport factor 2 family protein [Alphaproteobacteria bacterium]MCY4495743.1 nuclear transport factor 2 family protein [Rhodospirillaceae bacterium]
MATAKRSAAVEAVKDTVYRTCLLLDDERWSDWLELCDEEFYYKITAYSPEIRRDVLYLDGDREQIAQMCELLPKHNTDRSPLKRHAVVYTVDVDGGSAEAVTSFVIYQNMLDGVNSHIDAGENHLFAVGRYLDSFAIRDDEARFVTREVRLETRRLDKGTHWPL